MATTNVVRSLARAVSKDNHSVSLSSSDDDVSTPSTGSYFSKSDCGSARDKISERSKSTNRAQSVTRPGTVSGVGGFSIRKMKELAKQNQADGPKDTHLGEESLMLDIPH